MSDTATRVSIGIPSAPGAIPLLGHTYRLVRDPLEWLGECRQTGPVVRVKLGPRTAYLICDPAPSRLRQPARAIEESHASE